MKVLVLRMTWCSENLCLWHSQNSRRLPLHQHDCQPLRKRIPHSKVFCLFTPCQTLLPILELSEMLLLCLVFHATFLLISYCKCCYWMFCMHILGRLVFGFFFSLDKRVLGQLLFFSCFFNYYYLSLRFRILVQ